MPRAFAIAAALVLLLTTACGDAGPEAPPPALTDEVVATTPPMAWLAHRLLDGALPVVLPVPPDRDPATWRPDDDDLRRLRSARLIVANGAGHEAWMAGVSLPRSRLVETARALKDRWITVETTTHRHGAGGEHTHGSVDGHTWLDPLLLRDQARALAAALERLPGIDPGGISERLAALEPELESLDARWRALAPRLTAARVLAAHRRFAYPAARHGFRVTDFAFDPGQPLDDRDLGEIRRRVPVAETRLMLWDRTPVPETVAALQELGIASVVFAPLAGQGDWLALQHRNLDRLAAALR